MSWDHAQPAPLALWKLVHANFPQTRNLGIYNARNIAGTNTPSLHAEGRALDIGLLVSNPTEKYIGDELFELFIEHAQQMGLQEIIWDHQVWSTQRTYVHPYGGSNPHTDHVHVGFTRDGSQRTDFGYLLVEIGEIRTGLEEVSDSLGNYA